MLKTNLSATIVLLILLLGRNQILILNHDETISVVSWYHNDTINFSFESYEGNAWFSITNINTGQKYTCSYSTLQHPISINIGNTSGIYQINIKTTIGSEYEGWLTL